MTNHELMALLREVRVSVEHDFDWGEHDAAGRKHLLALLKRIDAALATHDAVPPGEVTVVASKDCPFCRTSMALGTLDGSTPALLWLDLQTPEQVKYNNPQIMGPHVVAGTWMCKICGFVSLFLDDEAKAAAITAARGAL